MNKYIFTALGISLFAWNQCFAKSQGVDELLAVAELPHAMELSREIEPSVAAKVDRSGDLYGKMVLNGIRPNGLNLNGIGFNGLHFNALKSAESTTPVSAVKERHVDLRQNTREAERLRELAAGPLGRF